MNKIDLKNKELIKSRSDSEEDREMSLALNDLIGCEIIDTGFIGEIREGGLTIDYIKEGQKKRLVLGYNDLGEWVWFNG